MYPKNVLDNLKFRETWLVKAEQDEEIRSVLLALAAKDILFFFNVFLWAEDPFAVKGLRHGVPKIRIRPVVTYPFQDGFILDVQKSIELGEDLIADKSRDMLATYIVLGVYLHGWLFKGHKYLITSWKEGEIDGKEDTSTHFGKLRFWLKRLPKWMLPRDFDWKKNSSYMKLQNPESGATLTGSAASANLASGRREDSIFLDELSKWEQYSSEAWTSASDATKCKIAVWTPRGSGNKAAELMKGAEVRKKYHLYWYLHPEKTITGAEHLERVNSGGVFDKVRSYVVQVHADQSKTPAGCYVDQYGKIRSEWYDVECETRTAEDIAENLDCDYLTTGSPVFDTLKCQENKYLGKFPEVGELIWRVRPVYNRDTGFVENMERLSVEFVPNSNGTIKIWEHPKPGWENGYVLSADTAEGLEQGDFNSGSVGRRFVASNSELVKLPDGEDFRMPTVAEIHNKLKTFEFAEELVKLAVYYGYAWIIPERNNTSGGAVVNELFKMYRKLFHDQLLTRGYPEQKDRIGFSTNQTTKGTIIKTLSKAISFGLIYDPCEEFWGECLTFVNNDGRMEAQGKSRGEKCYDDRVMDRALKLWAHKELPSATRKREVERIPEWKKKLMSKKQSDSLVGWVVNA